MGIYGRSFFISSDKTLYATGNNVDGGLGDGTEVDRDTFESIDTNVVAIGGGASASLYIKDDASLWTMGSNPAGELGDGSYTDHFSPKQVATGAISVAAGDFTTYYIRSDGSLWGAGLDDLYQLGDAFTNDTPSFTQIYPRPTFQITQAKVLSGTNLQIYATCGIGGSYSLVTSTNLAQPLSSWIPVSTNLISLRGINNYMVTLTNGIDRTLRARYYALHRLGDN